MYWSRSFYFTVTLFVVPVEKTDPGTNKTKLEIRYKDVPEGSEKDTLFRQVSFNYSKKKMSKYFDDNLKKVARLFSGWPCYITKWGR